MARPRKIGCRIVKFSTSISEDLFARLEEAWERRGYTSRSEAVREAIRRWLAP
jgi:metal-responsive CopG/Arc/MetJ family transcriptional regulator